MCIRSVPFYPMGRSVLKIIHQDCDKTLAEDKSLPYSAYLIEYVMDGKTCYDIAITGKASEIFDHYWDNYRHDFKNMTQTDGRANPKMWGNAPPKEKKGTRK